MREIDWYVQKYPHEADLNGKGKERDLVAEICDLRQRLLLYQNLAWNDLHPVTMTCSFRVTMLCLYFGTFCNDRRRDLYRLAATGSFSIP